MATRDNEGALKVLRLIARRLEEHLDGDELALETLGEALDQEDVTVDDLQGAILGLRGLARLEPPAGWVAGRAALGAHRVLSDEERETLTTESWGWLVDQRTRGVLDAEQFERVLEVLTLFGERPVDLERTREVTAHVVLDSEDAALAPESPHGDRDLAH